MAPLKHEQVVGLHAAIVSAGLAPNRDVLLGKIAREIVAGLPYAPDAAAQILGDINALNALGRLPDGSFPLEAWLRNAATLSKLRAEEPIFREALRELGLKPPPEAASKSGDRKGGGAVLGVDIGALALAIVAAMIAVVLVMHGEGPAKAAPVGAPEDAPRVIRAGQKLYLRHAPAGLDRDRLLYALSADPLPGTTDHVKIGILRGVDRTGDSLEVAWFTLVDDDVEAALGRAGLPIRLIQQDLEPRIGRHWGKYMPQPEATFRGPDGDVVLELNLGRDDGAQPGDQYEVLGEARTDLVNRTVDSFATLGTCTLRPFGAEATRSRCQIDRGIAAPPFEKRHWMSGGYVKAITGRKGFAGAR